MKLPIKEQLKAYNVELLLNDLIAAIVVTVLLIPQSLAYAMLAGVPAQVGLYASILPLIAYGLLGSSRTLSVGPVALASLMTASALANFTQISGLSYLDGAVTLALLSGLFLLTLGVFKLGFLANFLSHPVVTGFITASSLIIAISQFKHLLGIEAEGESIFGLLSSLLHSLNEVNVFTALIGILSLIFLWSVRCYGVRLFQWFGLSVKQAMLMVKLAPIVGVVLSTFSVFYFTLNQYGVAIVGDIPAGLPTISLPVVSMDAIELLWLPALLISIIGYVESVSVGKTLAGKRRQRISSNQELVGLGGANIASALSGAFPVTGGFSRSVVNFDAGAKTQLASIFAAIGIALATLFFTEYLFYLPKAMLAATIIIAVLALVDFSIFKQAWNYSKSDFMAVLATVLITLFCGVEMGVASGIATSILLHIYYTSKPHIAEVGLVPGTEHFRNILHYQVETQSHLVTLRIDESLLFSNANYLEDYINNVVFQRSEISDVVLQCNAVNDIDLSAIELLETLNHTLLAQGIKLHFSEVKIPIEKLLKKSGLLEHLSGCLFLRQYEAYKKLTK